MKILYKRLSIIFIMAFAIMVGYFTNVLAADSTNYTLKNNYSSSLVAKWIFDDTNSNYVKGTTVKDLSGKGNDLTMNNIVFKNDADLGRCAYFNGSDTYMQAGSSIIPAGRKSIILKFKPIYPQNSFVGDIGIITNCNVPQNNNKGCYIAYGINSKDTIGFWDCNGDGKWGRCIYAKQTIDSTKSNVYLFTENSSTNELKLYANDLVNYNSKTSLALAESYDTTSKLLIGKDNLNRYFKGYIQSIEIYNDVVEYEGISLNKTTDSIPVGQTDILTATITPDNATNKTIKWTSDKPEIATVNPITGEVKAVSEGTAIITATTQDGTNLSNTCTVTVSKAPVIATAITLNKSTDSLTIDESHQLTATIAPSDATTSNIIWTSSDYSTVNVDQTGKITGLKEGTATITVIIKDTNISAKCIVTVIPKGTTPTNPADNTGNAVLTITMTNGNVKAYTVPMTKVNDFISWYDNRVSGSTGKAYYTFDKTDNLQSFSKKTEYLIFDKISSYEVDEYSK